MEQDRLKQFIEDHRAEFDADYPSLGLWTAVEKQLPPAKTRRLPGKVWWQAAAMVALVVGAALVGHRIGSGELSPLDAQTALIHQELQETEQFYQREIKQHYAQLTQQLQDPRLEADLADIDRAMEEVRQELAQAPPGKQDQLIEKLIQNYRLKLQLLEYIQDKLEKANENSAKITNHATEI